MAVGFSFVFLLLLLILGGGLAIPVAALFHAGLTCAREDAHRVTPEDPWVFFWRGARGKARVIILALLVLIIIGILLSWSANHTESYWVQVLHVASLPLALGLSVLATSGFVAFLNAPRFRGPVALGAMLLGLTLLLMVAGIGLSIFFLPDPLRMATYTYEHIGPNGQTMQNHWMIPTFPFTYLAFSAVLLWGGWRWAKSKGERWFRFEG